MKHYKIILILLACILSSVAYGQKQQQIKTAYPKDKITKLVIDNKYGKINIFPSQNDSVSIAVTIRRQSSRKTNKTVSVNLSLENKVLSTSLDLSNKVDAKDFRIDYDIQIPSDKELDVRNIYGDVYVQQIDAPARFDLTYSDLTVRKALDDDLDIKVTYGDVSIIEAVDINCKLTYADFKIEKVNQINIQSAYTDIDINQANEIYIESRYDDVEIGEVKDLTVDDRYSDISISSVLRNSAIDAVYSSVIIYGLSPDFETVDFGGKYSDFHVEVGELQYRLELSGRYTDVEYSTAQHSFTGSSSKTSSTTNISGLIGEEVGDRVIKIDAIYGDVDIRN